jgi:hypothetical protein
MSPPDARRDAPETSRTHSTDVQGIACVKAYTRRRLGPMPMLADIDDPPRRSLPHLVVGLCIAAAAAGIAIVWLFPWLSGSVLGGARDFDTRARAQDAYMKTLCSTVFDLERDGELCKCVLAVDHPALDCQPPFRRWALARQAERCAENALAQGHPEYCECVREVALAVDAAAEVDKNAKAHGYDRCDTLANPLPLPEIET